MERRILVAVGVLIFVLSMVQVLNTGAVIDERSIDLFSQKGGRGFSFIGPPFVLFEEVFLHGDVSYNGVPMAGLSVTFQIFNPDGIFFILGNNTNAEGVATIRFRLPDSENVFGDWRAITSVSIVDVTVTDTLDFNVRWNLADVNNDYIININDAILICSSYRSTSTDPEWNANYDIAQPYGIIDIFDVVLLTASFGEEY